MTVWPEFLSQCRISDAGSKQLKVFADVPTGLIYLEPDELRRLVQGGFLTTAQCRRMADFFDDWCVLDEELHLAGRDRDAVVALFLRPSELLDQGDSEAKRRLIHEAGCKPSVAHRIVQFVTSASMFRRLTWVSAIADAADDDDDYPARLPPAIEPEFQFAANQRATVWRARGVMDEAMASAIRQAPGDQPWPTIRVVLNKLQSLSDSPPDWLDVSGGYLVSLDDINRSLPPSVSIVNLATNRIPMSEFDNLLALLKTVAKRNGAVVVTANPVASLDAREHLERLAASDLVLFTRLIWIPQKWLKARAWTYCLGARAAQVANEVEAAHEAFYAAYKEAQKDANIISIDIDSFTNN
jgi:hypothetical protein